MAMTEKYNLMDLYDAGRFVEEQRKLKNLREKARKKRIENRFLSKNDRRLLAKLIVWAAYNRDEKRIIKYINYIYRKLFGHKWYYNNVWEDQPINWLDTDLINWINGEDCDVGESWTYDQLFEHTYDLIDELCNDKDGMHDI